MGQRYDDKPLRCKNLLLLSRETPVRELCAHRSSESVLLSASIAAAISLSEERQRESRLWARRLNVIIIMC